MKIIIQLEVPELIAVEIKANAENPMDPLCPDLISQDGNHVFIGNLDTDLKGALVSELIVEMYKSKLNPNDYYTQAKLF